MSSIFAFGPVFSPSRGGFRGVDDVEVVKLNFQSVDSNFQPGDDWSSQFSAANRIAICLAELWNSVEVAGGADPVVVGAAQFSKFSSWGEDYITSSEVALGRCLTWR